MVAQKGTSPMDPHSPVDGSLRKRVCKACDRCRLKKSKCDGLSVCSRCRVDNAICVFGERKKSHDKIYPKGYVEMLEQQQAQLVAGLQELYRRAQNGQGWDGAPLKESSCGTPLTHDILERLGILKAGGQNSASQRFEEDLSSLQQRLLANGAEIMHRSSSDSGSDSRNSPAFDQASQKIPFADPFTNTKLPLTPLSHCSLSRDPTPAVLSKTDKDKHAAQFPKAAENGPLRRRTQTSSLSAVALGGNTDPLNPYKLPIDMNVMSDSYDAPQMPVGTIAPYLSMRDWNHDVEFQNYFTAVTM